MYKCISQKVAICSLWTVCPCFNPKRPFGRFSQYTTRGSHYVLFSKPTISGILLGKKSLSGTSILSPFLFPVVWEIVNFRELANLVSTLQYSLPIEDRYFTICFYQRYVSMNYSFSILNLLYNLHLCHTD